MFDEIILSLPEIVYITDPWILFEILYEVVTNRIEVNVTDQFQQVRILVAQNRLVTSLKEMSHLVIFQIEISGIPELKGLHHLGQGCRSHLHQKVT